MASQMINSVTSFYIRHDHFEWTGALREGEKVTRYIRHEYLEKFS